MNNKKRFFATVFLICFGLLAGLFPQTSYAEEGPTAPTEEPIEGAEYNFEFFTPEGQKGSNEPQYYQAYDPYIGPYYLIDTFTGKSSIIDTAGEWTQQFAAAAIPFALSLNPWSIAAGTATFNTFNKPPTTKYYKTWVYQAKGTNYYYGRSVAKEYSDPERTKLVKTVVHTSQVAR